MENDKKPWEVAQEVPLPTVKEEASEEKTAPKSNGAPIAAGLPWEIARAMPIEPPVVREEPSAPPARTGRDKFEDVFSKLIGQESGGKHMVGDKLLTSPVGAEGITQVMPKTGVDPGYGVEPIKNKSREEYVRFGKDYLRAMLKEFEGDYEKALAAYNAGAGSVKKAILKGGADWKEYLPKKSETIPYINNILGNRNG